MTGDVISSRPLWATAALEETTTRSVAGRAAQCADPKMQPRSERMQHGYANLQSHWPTQSAHQQPLARLPDARLSLPELQEQSALAVRRPRAARGPDDSGLTGDPAVGQPRRGRSTSHVHVAGGSLAGNDHSLISSTVGRAEARWFSST
jgi:hypothetical protein